MTSDDWNLVCILAEELNITNAAERLYTSQSTISYRIRRIEDELGTALFVRSKTGLTITSSGVIFLHYAQDMLAQFKLLKEQLHSSVSVLNGSFRLGVSTAIAYHTLPFILNAFSGPYPGIKIFPKSNTSSKLVEMFQKDEVDVAIVRGGLPSDILAEHLFQEPLYLVSKTPYALSELSSHPYLNNTNSNDRQVFAEWCLRRIGETPSISMDVDNIEVCIQMISQGFGWTILPALTIAARRGFSATPLLWEDGTPVLRETSLLQKHGNLSIDAFCNFIKEKLPPYVDKLIAR